MLTNKKQKLKVLNTPTLKDASEQLEYIRELYNAAPGPDTLAMLNRAYMVYQTKLINQGVK